MKKEEVTDWLSNQDFLVMIALHVGLIYIAVRNSLTRLVITETIITRKIIGIMVLMIAFTSIGVTMRSQPPYMPLNSLTKLVITEIIITRKIIGISVFSKAETSMGVTIF